MPRLRIAPKHRLQLTEPRVLRHLIVGHGADDVSDATLRAAWKLHRQDIIDNWIAHEEAHRTFGSRPWAWWQFDAPEPRRLIAGTEGPDDGYHRHGRRHPREMFFGVPQTTTSPTAEYESQADYLRRLDLLTDAERKLIAQYGEQDCF